MAGAGAYGSGGMGAMASAAVSAGSATVNYAASAVASSMAQARNLLTDVDKYIYSIHLFIN